MSHFLEWYFAGMLFAYFFNRLSERLPSHRGVLSRTFGLKRHNKKRPF